MKMWLFHGNSSGALAAWEPPIFLLDPVVRKNSSTPYWACIPIALPLRIVIGPLICGALAPCPWQGERRHRHPYIAQKSDRIPSANRWSSTAYRWRCRREIIKQKCISVLSIIRTLERHASCAKGRIKNMASSNRTCISRRPAMKSQA